MRCIAVALLFTVFASGFLLSDLHGMSSRSGFVRKKQRGQERPQDVSNKRERGLNNLLSILRSIFEPKRPAGYLRDASICGLGRRSGTR